MFEFEDKDPEVYLVHEEITKGNCIPFFGACIDTGTQKSVIGVEQARAYCQFMNVQYEPERMERWMSFKFGNTRHTGLGELEVRMPVDNTYFLSISIQVVDVNVPLLLGLDFLDAFGMNVDASRDILRSEERGWSFDLVRKFGHLYVEWDAGNYYTAKELKKIHRHFFHPDTGRLYAMLKRADAEETTPDVMGNLETITKECDICQRHMKEPRSFRVALPPEKVVFNKVVLMDRMTLSGKPVLHMVDRDTKFSVAEFLQGESAKEAWNVYMSAWATTYIGFSDEIHADQGPQFRSREFQTYAADADIKLTLSGVESHNSLGVGERYHDYLRKIYKKTRDEHPNISLEYSLKLAVKAMNDTAGSNGLVPTLLVFGVMPRIPLRKRHLPGMVDRMKAMDAARSEVSKLIARDRLKKAVKSNVPAAADKVIQVGEQVLVYKEKPINQWIGPFHVRDVNAKTVFVDMNGGTSQLSIDKVKVYVKPEIEEDEGEVSSTRTLSPAQQS